MTRGKSWSYLGLTAILFLAASGPALAQTTEPMLRLEVGTHNAGIWGIAIDPSNRILVTGSEDKTARVWDISGRGEWTFSHLQFPFHVLSAGCDRPCARYYG